MDLSARLALHLDRIPAVHSSAWIASTATVLGDVTIGEEASVWYSAVLRGDINSISVGAHSNIQDGAVIHLADDFPTIIGEWVTVGHQAILHACTIGSEVLIGMGAVILDGAQIGARSIVGAGALVTGGKVIPPGSLVLGSPAKVARPLTVEEQDSIRPWAEKYVRLSREYILRGIK